MATETKRLLKSSLVAVLVVLAGCGPADPGTDAGVDSGTPAVDSGTPDSGMPDAGVRTLESIALTASSTSVAAGGTLTVTATGTFSDGTMEALTALTWESSDFLVATVDGMGVVTGVKPGTATITARKSGKSGTVSVTITPPTSLVLFGDDFMNGEIFKPFDAANAATWAARVTRDTAEHHDGVASLKLHFEPGAGSYMGGAFQTPAGKDLTYFNALTFWAKSSVAATLDTVGFGNNGANTDYQVERHALAITTTWQKFVIPLPVPAKLGSIDGVFHFADDVGTTYDLYIDELKYETVTLPATATPTIATEARSVQVGNSTPVNGKGIDYAGTETYRIDIAGRYFTFASSMPSVATVDAAGVVTGVAVGTSAITAKLGTVDATGALTVTVTPVSVAAPTTAPARPTVAAGSVISLLSDAYTNVSVDSWRTSWSAATLTDVTIGGDAMKKYSTLDFVGIETTTTTVNASTMTHLHMDVWTADATTFRIKLVDFGADGVFGGTDNSEHELVFNATSTPALAQGAWVSIDVPLSNFTNLASRAHLAQYILSALPAGNATVFVSNFYFYAGAAPTAPTTAPARPTKAPANVISLLSNAYTNVAVDSWRTSWSAATLTDVTIGGDAMKKYSALDFAGIETTTTTVNASTMTHVHVDVWTPDATTFRIKLVDFGADGVFGGTDNSEHELVFNSTSTPALAQGAWVGIDVPLTAFTNLTNRAHLAQYIVSAAPAGTATVFVSNFYFYSNATPTAPTTAPARPTVPAANVISLLSNAYTNVAVDSWRTSWSAATLTDVTIGGDAMKKYSALDFVGIETTTTTVNASTMTHLHVDVWTPDATTFRIKLVDFGADGVFGGTDNTEHELVFNATSTPALTQGGWVSLELPLSSFTNLTNRAHLAQYILSAQPTAAATVFVANVYFHN